MTGQKTDPGPEAAPRRVTIREVGPRDGLQIEPRFLPTGAKVALIDALVASGLRHVQATSFVSPRAVPQLADAEAVMAGIRRVPGLRLSALAPNARGAERAARAGADAIGAVVSCSGTHNAKNLNRTVERSLADAAEVAAIARGAGAAFEMGLATAFGCPFEGEVPPARVERLAARAAELGATHIGLGDTTGMAVPPTVRAAVEAVRRAAPGVEIGLHFHNTRGVGLACVMVGLEMGVDHYDGSVGGLGGCPFAPGATGNVATEDLVYLLQESGFETGVDLAALIDAAHLAQDALGRELPGQVMKAGPRLRRHDPGAVATAAG